MWCKADHMTRETNNALQNIVAKQSGHLSHYPPSLTSRHRLMRRSRCNYCTLLQHFLYGSSININVAIYAYYIFGKIANEDTYLAKYKPFASSFDNLHGKLIVNILREDILQIKIESLCSITILYLCKRL